MEETTDTQTTAVIVRAATGPDYHIQDRHEQADDFLPAEDGGLLIYRGSDIIAAYAPGRWISVVIEKEGS